VKRPSCLRFAAAIALSSVLRDRSCISCRMSVRDSSPITLTPLYKNLHTQSCRRSRSCGSGSARRDIRAFPADARRRSGFQLRKVQQGLEPDYWKPMTSVGPGVREIRIQIDLAHRVFYVATFEEAVYVLHAFEKKTRKTSRRDLKLGRERYLDLLKKRAKDAKKK
jgi:phage-related protein